MTDYKHPINQIAKENGYNMNKLAQTTGLNYNTLLNYQTRKTNIDNIPIFIYVQIAKALNISIDQLYTTLAEKQKKLEK